jgi:hypothetical protein
MKLRLLHVFAYVLLSAHSQAVAVEEPDTIREWTSVDGKKLIASFLGTKDGSVYLKLASGKTVPVPVTKLSDADQVFLASHPVDYRPAWKGWTGDVSATPSASAIRERSGGEGVFFYTTRRFQFETNANLGPLLTMDMGRLFELTYSLNSQAPLGIQSQPDGEFYQAKLCATLDQYLNLGAPQGSAGFYDLRKRRFFAPLELMGLTNGSAGWRKASQKDADLTTIIHELTHMLTHDTLQLMPLWFSEGYAEYVSNVPLEGAAFKTGEKKMSERMVDLLVRENDSAFVVPSGTRDIGYGGGGGKPRGSGKTDPKERIYQMRPVAEMLELPDDRWGKVQVGGFNTGAAKLKYYRTAHLMVYYFYQIEGEAGARKVAAMLDRNKVAVAKLDAYQEEAKRYNEAMEEFKRKPGVRQLLDGRIEYPSSLTPPARPADKPPVDPARLKREGIEALLGGESAAVVGARIERALQEQLGVQIRFDVK